jgi:ABC-type protease/lipase transport system fused ATPase/permease subunit
MVLEIALGVFIGLALADAVKDLSEFLATKWRAHQSHKRLQQFLKELHDEPRYEYKLPTPKRKPAVKKAAAKKKPVKKRK